MDLLVGGPTKRTDSPLGDGPSPRGPAPHQEDENDPDLATLTEDHESLRKHLQIDKWLVYGSGGWSSAAALHYAKTYPDRTLGLVLQGVFSGSGSKEEVMNLFTRSGFMRTCIASFEANVAGRVSAVARRREWEQEHVGTRGAAAALQHMWYG